MPDGRGRIALGFDFGLKRIGIASGDTVSGAAAPRAVVRVSERGADWVAIAGLLRQFRPELLVVGSPLHADGSQRSQRGGGSVCRGARAARGPPRPPCRRVRLIARGQ